MEVFTTTLYDLFGQAAAPIQGGSEKFFVLELEA